MSKLRAFILMLTSGRPSRVNHRFSSSLSSSLVRLLCLCALSTQVGCDEESLKKFGESLNQDCIETAVALDEALSKEGRLEEEIQEEAPFPMTLLLSQDSLNALFRSVAEQSLEPISLTLGELLGFEVTATVTPALPLIRIEAVEDCETCIVTEVSFGLSLDVAGFSLGAEGDATYQFPVRIEAEGVELSRVLADFDRSLFQQLDLRVTEELEFELPFVELTTNDVIDYAEPYLTDYLNELVQDSYGTTELFALKPW